MEVIITSDDFVSVRATILLGELLYMVNRSISYNSGRKDCGHVVE